MITLLDKVKANLILEHDADDELLQRLIDAAHNPALSELYRYTASVVTNHLRKTMDVHPRRQKVFDLHVELLQAVEQQNPQRAMALCRTLINEP